MTIRVFPEPVRMMQASRSMRIRHELWHFVRAVWGNPLFPDEGRVILRDLGWELPDDRAPFDTSRHLHLDNHSGEDFFYMHRDMIAMTDKALKAVGEPPMDRWDAVPEPGDSDFTVPPAWVYNDPAGTQEDNEATTRFLQSVKSDEYFESTMRVRDSFLTNPSNLRRLSLGALGNLAEMTIHNMLHMRWSTYPGGYRPQIDIGNPTGGSSSWDELSYDYLGDTYSSQVNPHFWYLHGWIDNLIDLWAAVNQVAKIDWKGTWLGGPDLEPQLAEAEFKDRIIRLHGLTADLPFPTTLLEIAREDI